MIRFHTEVAYRSVCCLMPTCCKCQLCGKLEQKQASNFSWKINVYLAYLFMQRFSFCKQCLRKNTKMKWHNANSQLKLYFNQTCGKTSIVKSEPFKNEVLPHTTQFKENLYKYLLQSICHALIISGVVLLWYVATTWAWLNSGAQLHPSLCKAMWDWQGAQVQVATVSLTLPYSVKNVAVHLSFTRLM